MKKLLSVLLALSLLLGGLSAPGFASLSEGGGNAGELPASDTFVIAEDSGSLTEMPETAGPVSDGEESGAPSGEDDAPDDGAALFPVPGDGETQSAEEEAGEPAVTLDDDGRTAVTENFTGFRARVSLVLDNNGVSALLVTEAVINEDGTIVIPAFQVPGVTVTAVCAALVPVGEELVRPDPTVGAYDWRRFGGGFAYLHDPRDNPEAMKDITEDPDAVYGFSPDPLSTRLGSYAAYDWSDPALVAQAAAERRAYHDSLLSMTEMMTRMQAEGASLETIARAVSAERNRLRLASYGDDPARLAEVMQSNLETYGHEDGPTPDELYEKYGSWEMVLQKAFSPNLGMDVCCGLYDEYYPLYIALGLAEG